jgi:hypothetical protein
MHQSRRFDSWLVDQIMNPEFDNGLEIRHKFSVYSREV